MTAAPAAPPPAAVRQAAWAGRVSALSVVLLGLIAYAGAWKGPFVYDDRGSVVDNPTIRHLLTALHPPAGGWPVSGRPVVNFTFGANYAISRLDPWSYHAGNVALHLAGALALFGVVRRTLLLRGGSARPAATENPVRCAALAGIAAALWAVHPLQTESVTYVSQRAESLMGLFFLLTLYGFIRLAQAPAGGRRKWWLATAAACALGMATKEVMVTAPVIVFAYDRVFVSGSFRQAWRSHRRFHLSLAATWIVLFWLLRHGAGRGGTAGWGTQVSVGAYALTQTRALVTYLKLALWPHPLVFTRPLVLGGPPGQVAAAAAAVLALALGSIVGVCRGSAVGFLGFWFFGILAPSSSVVPVATEYVAEHRVYLSLAAVVVGLVVMADRGLRQGADRCALTPRAGAVLGFALAAVVIASATAATVVRNRAYSSVLRLWQDTVAHSPDDPGPRNNLGNALAEAGRTAEAVEQFQAALRLAPQYDDPQQNLGNALIREGRPAEALPHLLAALKSRPRDAALLQGVGVAFARLGDERQARQALLAAAAGESDAAGVWFNLGNALLERDELAAAESSFRNAVRLRPDYLDAIVNHAGVLARIGRSEAAIAEFQAALRLDPTAADAHNNLAGLLAEEGRLSQAKGEFEQALRLRPDYPEARNNLQRVNALIAAQSHP